MQALLSTTYFGPVQWYQKLVRYDRILIERHDSYRKQTYRNRCVIATANGPQVLTVPVERGSEAMRVSAHANWPHVHWHALMTAYGDSPFFDYYADDLQPFFNDAPVPLHDFNMAICRKMCELLDIHPDIRFTDSYVHDAAAADGVSAAGDILAASQSDCTPVAAGAPEITHEYPEITHDFRDVIHPKHPLPDVDFSPRPYYQVYSRRHGFLPNLSILDLLFNMGPESIFWLIR